MTMMYRAMGAAVLDPSIYEWIERDRSSIREAFGMVLLSSLAAGIGAGGFDGPRLNTLTLVTVLALATWLIWASLIQFVGGQLLPEPDTRVTFAELLRTTGFAATPGLLQVFAIIPSITVPVFIASWLWMLAAMIVAVRQALDFRKTWHAIVVCVVALAIALSTGLVTLLAMARTVA